MPAESIPDKSGFTIDSRTSAPPIGCVDNYFNGLCAIDVISETEELFNINTALPADQYNVLLSSIREAYCNTALAPYPDDYCTVNRKDKYDSYLPTTPTLVVPRKS